MGAEQSSGAAGGGKFRDDNSHSIPAIGQDTGQPTPGISYRSKLASTSGVPSSDFSSARSSSFASDWPPGSSNQNAAQQQQGRTRGYSLVNPTTTGSRDIVVVSKGTQQKGEDGDVGWTDTELKRLDRIPVFGPLMRGGAGTHEMQERFDHKAILHYYVRFQDHLKQCAEAVSFDQNTLTTRMKEIDFETKTLHDLITERLRKYARHTDQLHKVQEMTHILTRARGTANCLAQVMDDLNSRLPQELQLEPFSFLPTDCCAGQQIAGLSSQPELAAPDTVAFN